VPARCRRSLNLIQTENTISCTSIEENELDDLLSNETGVPQRQICKKNGGFKK
jgi:hypothetical protein